MTLSPSETPAAFEHSTSYFTGSNSPQLFEQWWRPQIEPKAAMVIVHGYAEHSGRYGHVGAYLAAKGYAVGTYDLRGHGRSDGKRTFIRQFDEHLQDLRAFLNRVPQVIPDKPVFLFGHSLGGAIAVLYAITHQPTLQGLLLSGAALKISEDISPLLQKLSGIIGTLFPTLPTIKLDSGWLCRSPEVVRQYDSDPLVYRKGTLAGTGLEILRATEHIQAKMEAVQLPLLILHGGADRVTDPQGSRQLYERAQAADKTLNIYDGLYHELVNEPEQATVLQEMTAWMDQRIY